MPWASRGYLARHDGLGTNDELTLGSLELCLQIVARLGRHAEMGALAEELIAGRRRAHGADDPRVASALRWRSAAQQNSAAATKAPTAASKAPSESLAFSRSLDILSALTSGTVKGVIEGVLK